MAGANITRPLHQWLAQVAPVSFTHSQARKGIELLLRLELDMEERRTLSMLLEASIASGWLRRDTINRHQYHILHRPVLATVTAGAPAVTGSTVTVPQHSVTQEPPIYKPTREARIAMLASVLMGWHTIITSKQFVVETGGVRRCTRDLLRASSRTLLHPAVDFEDIRFEWVACSMFGLYFYKPHDYENMYWRPITDETLHRSQQEEREVGTVGNPFDMLAYRVVNEADKAWKAGAMRG